MQSNKTQDSYSQLKNIIQKDKVKDEILNEIFKAKELNYEDLISKPTKKQFLKRLNWLRSNGLIYKNSDNGSYHLVSNKVLDKEFDISVGIDEYKVFTDFVMPLELEMNQKAFDCFEYGFTEILNNSHEHSQGKAVLIMIYESILGFTIRIVDDGVGIFKKIKKEKRLKSEEDALFQLYKGKLTTDSDNHSGEGIFFTSRAMDSFMIISNDLVFSHNKTHNRDVLSLGMSGKLAGHSGTFVDMRLNKKTDKNIVEVFQEFQDDELGFSKTIVPLSLANYTNSDSLVSRSQAKRVLLNLDNFQEVVFDFEGLRTVGQGFIDQIFRVYKSKNPDKELGWVNAAEKVESMINRVINTAKFNKKLF